MVVAGIVEICRLKYAGEPGNYYDLNARDNITPCQNIDDYNPYRYQDYLAGVGDVDSKPANCYTTCSSYYESNNVQYLNLTCIDCDNIPQMSHMSVFWQVARTLHCFVFSSSRFLFVSQIFQFFLIGTAEILASVTALEFFYSQVNGQFSSCLCPSRDFCFFVVFSTGTNSNEIRHAIS
jgi:hypothetical protein